ncbi:hypothetical protein N9K75_02610 [bacterium]|nr:hypothetical protein [bacterium]
MGEFPNKSTQFTSESRKTSKNKHGAQTATILNRILDADDDEPYELRTMRAKMCAAQIAKAAEGDTPAFREVLDRTEGKVENVNRNTVDAQVATSQLTPEQTKEILDKLNESF